MSLTFVPNKIQQHIYLYISIYLYKWSKMRMVMTYNSFEARDFKKIFMLRKRQFVSQLKHNAVYEFNFHDFKLI